MDADMQLCRWSSDSRCVERAVEVFGILVDVSRLHSILVLGDAGRKSVNRLANERALQLVSNAIFQVERSAGGTPRHHRIEVPRTQSKAD